MNGIKEGLRIEYFDNGKLKSKGELKNNKREGYWIDHYISGPLDKNLTGIYKNGKKISD